MTEFALIAPILFLITMAVIDFGRLLYTYGALSNAAREGARVVSTAPQEFSDCLAISRMEVVGQGFPLQPDPTSLYGDTDPNGTASQATSPPVGVGYFYIWPAVANSTPQDDPSGNNCKSPTPPGGTPQPRPIGASGSNGAVRVLVQYNFMPLTPLITQFFPNGLIVKCISNGITEYTGS